MKPDDEPVVKHVRDYIVALLLNDRFAKGADYESFEAHCAGINSLVWDLHTVFHEVAKRHLDNFSDDPRTPLRVVYARGEERREQMVEAQSAGASHESA